MKQILAATAILLCLAACSSEPVKGKDEAPAVSNTSSQPIAAPPAPRLPVPVDVPAAEMLTLEGLGELRVGQSIPRGSGWAERGAQISDECRTINSPAYPGAYAIVEEGKVRRITVGSGSSVRLVEGIGVGSAEAEVRAAFPGFREQPHKYSEPPAKYLTAPNAASGDPALRFEIGADRRVSLIHVGTMPVLIYVEGCA
jgi:hypothetical protein